MKILATKMTDVLSWSHQNGFKNWQGGYFGWKWVPTTSKYPFLLVKTDIGWKKPHKDCGVRLSKGAAKVLSLINDMIDSGEVTSYETVKSLLTYAKERGFKVSRSSLVSLTEKKEAIA